MTIDNTFIEYMYECNIKEYSFKYYVGQHVVCRQTFKRKRAQLYTNYQYEIINIEKKSKDDKYIITVKSLYDDILMFITYNQLKYVSLPYSSTCHSCQGTTINEQYTIFDSNIVYCDRRWIWTPITRSTDLKHITIFEYSNNESKPLEKCKYKQYSDLKIKNYFIQNELAGRIKRDKKIHCTLKIK